MIQINKLYKNYLHGGYNVSVLKNLNLNIIEGEIVSIIGPSGVGKTTFLNILGILDSYKSGEYYFNKQNISILSPSSKNKFRNEYIGFVHQFFHLIPELTIIENVALPKMILGFSKNDSFKAAQKLLITFGLENRQLYKPSYLSGGEQQRVSIARALINKPKLIIADEMTGNLDENTADEIFEFFLNEISKNKQTLIFATHNTKYANMATKKLELTHGKFIN